MIDDEAQIQDLLAQPGKAVRAALKILEVWQTTDDQAAAILGITPETLGQWRQADHFEINQEQYERVGHVVAMWAYLQLLFPENSGHARWPQLPNTAPLFHGLPPMQLMATGNLEDLAQVSRWVAGWRYNT